MVRGAEQHWGCGSSLNATGCWQCGGRVGWIEGSLDRTTQATGQHCRGGFYEDFVARTGWMRWALEDKDR